MQQQRDELTEPYRDEHDRWVFPPGYANCIADPVEDMKAQALGTHPDEGINNLTRAEHAGRERVVCVVEVGDERTGPMTALCDEDKLPSTPHRVHARVRVEADGSRRLLRAPSRAPRVGVPWSGLRCRARRGRGGGRPGGRRRTVSRSAGGGSSDDGPEPEPALGRDEDDEVELPLLLAEAVGAG
jgi:hypothetical protein